MKIVEIKPKDEFTFAGMVKAFGADGKEHLIVNYKKSDDKITLTFEGFRDSDRQVAYKTMTYTQLMHAFKNRRVYIQGYVEV